MELHQLIQKAALLADLKGDLPAAESVLRAGIEQNPEMIPDRIRAQVFLAELLLTHDRPAALEELRGVLQTRLPADWDDILDGELTRAKRLLASNEADTERAVQQADAAGEHRAGKKSRDARS